MLSDYRELLSILNAHRVKYLVIGAYAVAIHAQPRETKDLDILVKADTENAKAVFAALVEFTRKPICGRPAFPAKTCLQQSGPPADGKTSPT
jgi:hypothetical protein